MSEAIKMQETLAGLSRDVLAERADQACRRIAPVWPLDSFVAVNPYLGLLDQPFDEAGHYLESVAGERLFMDRGFFAAQVEEGRIRPEDLQAAADRLGLAIDLQTIRQRLRTPRQIGPAMPMLVEMHDRLDAPPVSEFVIEQISHFLGAHYDRGQALWRSPVTAPSLFAAWREYTLIDRSARAAGLGEIREPLRSLPADADEALAWAVNKLEIPDAMVDDYFFGALKSIRGWASWCRYRLWQAEMQGGSSHELQDLLIIRVLWDALTLCVRPDRYTHQSWLAQIGRNVGRHAAPDRTQERFDELLLTAAEIAFRRPFIEALANPERQASAQTETRPVFQAAFCIDVRSEVFRRHLESAVPGAQTIGFAGFFGVPLSYRRLGEEGDRTHTPVLLNPGVPVCDHAEQADALAEARARRLGAGLSWKQFKLSASSCFTFVESAGLSYVPRLLADTFGWHTPSSPPDRAGLTDEERRAVHPDLGDDVPLEARADLAAGILAGLGLGENAAPLVMLAGHGSSTTNNPHRAGLDCGACAGQTGEVSARVACSLLNDSAVRAELASRGVGLPEDTRFVPALHDTTTDEVELLDDAVLDQVDAESRRKLSEGLAAAGDLTRLERLVALRGGTDDAEAAVRNVSLRGRDWSQVRPEWGLAGNGAFIAAPRYRTRGLDLGGRAFLHDYDWQKDADFSLLTLIMTAPLVVANWINLQYYGSTVDNAHQGCGNKVLHNVVGGLVGVLEGNGGDLRVGLSMQSLHDGEQWRHEPLRLSAFIEAPAEAMDQVIADNELLDQLISNRWLNLFRIAPDGTVQRRRPEGGWVEETSH
ncbi:MAG: YbcC family protein [Halothiobacillaceae bacterium]